MARSGTESTVEAFLSEAASPGYTYPNGEPYTLVQDHAAWLDGALRLIQEEFQPMEQLPLYRIGEHHVSVEGWVSEDKLHLFRASSTLKRDGDGSAAMRWPEFCLCAFDSREIEVHNYLLPSVRKGRLISPLCMAYQHPSFANINYRLAKIDGDKDFAKSWKKIARWEIQPNPSWEEWRRGIEKDKCIDAIRETYIICPTLDEGERKRLLYDIEQMCSAQEKPSIFPRYRERCPACTFRGLCHGSAEDRSEYTPVNLEEIARFQKRAMAGK
jgi:hypothetical protein